jgi:hypothetical protein
MQDVIQPVLALRMAAPPVSYWDNMLMILDEPSTVPAPALATHCPAAAEPSADIDAEYAELRERLRLASLLDNPSPNEVGEVFGVPGTIVSEVMCNLERDSHFGAVDDDDENVDLLMEQVYCATEDEEFWNGDDPACSRKLASLLEWLLGGMRVSASS